MPDLDDPRLLGLIDLGFDFACGRTLGDFVDADRVVDAVTAGATEARVAHLHARYIVPARERWLARAAGSDIKLGAWWPAAARDAFATMLGEPWHIPRKWIDAAVASEQVRDNVRTMLQDTLTSFVARVTSGGGGGGGAVGGALGLGARVVGGVGRGLLGGLGDGLQKQLQERAKDFVDGQVAALQQRIAKQLASDETARDIGRRRRRGFLALLERTEKDAANLFRRAPWSRLDALWPSLVAHNAARAELRDVVRDELRTALAELSKSTVGELLDELGQRDALREAVRAQGLPLARAFVATEGFGAWWLDATAR